MTNMTMVITEDFNSWSLRSSTKLQFPGVSVVKLFATKKSANQSILPAKERF